jgi:hypothetical protein
MRGRGLREVGYDVVKDVGLWALARELKLDERLLLSRAFQR